MLEGTKRGPKEWGSSSTSLGVGGGRGSVRAPDSNLEMINLIDTYMITTTCD